MTAWMGDGPVQLGREAQIQMIRAEAAERAEWRQRQAEAEERREAHAGELQRFYVQHGCYPNDLLARQREHAARVEEAAEARRAQEREWLAEERRLAAIMAGGRPRTVAEVLAAAAGIVE